MNMEDQQELPSTMHFLNALSNEDLIAALSERIERLELFVTSIAQINHAPEASTAEPQNTSLTRQPSLCLSSTSSTSAAVPNMDAGLLGRIVSIPRSQLDHYCYPLLRQTLEPSFSEMTEIATTLRNQLFPTLHVREGISQIRKWFRKRREEIGLRVLASFRRRFAPHLSNEEARAMLRFNLNHSLGTEYYIDLSGVMQDAQITTQNQNALDVFVRTKIAKFLDKLTCDYNVDLSEQMEHNMLAVENMQPADSFSWQM